MITVVERDVDPALGGREQQAAALWVGAHRARVRAARELGRQSRHDFRPGLAVVVRAIDVWPKVAAKVQVECGVRRAPVELGRFDCGADRTRGDLDARDRDVVPRPPMVARDLDHAVGRPRPDRKSTRLNSSHLVISYAVFCLKKKKKYFSLFFIKKIKTIDNKT